jgi:hypothetical protein
VLSGAASWQCGRCLRLDLWEVARVQVRPDAHQGGRMSGPVVRPVGRDVSVNLSDQGGFDRQVRQGLAVGQVADPAGRQWARPFQPAPAPGQRLLEQFTAAGVLQQVERMSEPGDLLVIRWVLPAMPPDGS